MKADYSSDSGGNVVQLHYGKLAIDGTISWRKDFNVTSGINGICCYGTSYLRLDTSSNAFLSFSNSSATYVAWSIGGYLGWHILELDKAPNDVTSLLQLSSGQMFVAYASTRSNTMFGRLWNGSTWEKEEVVTTSQFELFTITKDYRTDSYYLTTYGESKGLASVNTYLETHHSIRHVNQFSMNVSPCGCSGGFPSLTSDMLSSYASKSGGDVFNVYYVMATGGVSEWLCLSQIFHVNPTGWK